MELFDKRFVHFMWDDELDGKKCFVADDISTLKSDVSREACSKRFGTVKKGVLEYPFQMKSGNWRFAYYDPNYEVKKAFNEGKKVQVKRIDSFADWVDCIVSPEWCYDCEYRVKPGKRYRPYNNSDEMIADFIARFKVNCPPYAEPLIWVKGKYAHPHFLIFAFYETFIKFNDDKPFMFKELFDDYTYLDGSPVGMEVNE